MKIFLIVSIVGMMAAASFGAIPSFYDGFESYAASQTFVAETNGWQASGPEATVSGSGGYTNSRAAFLGAPVALTNTLDTADPSLKVWIDFRAKPMLGLETPNLPTNTASFLCYFNSNGVLLVATPGGWYVCTNDFRGNNMAPATTNDYVHLSVYQDYSTSNQAVFLNEKLMLQDFGFVGTAGSYSRFVTQNSDSNNTCWLDNVWVKTNYDAASLTNDVNADGLADAYELQQYGHARITLYVNGGGTPSYASIQAAINASGPRDIISVTTAPAPEGLTITHSLFFEGANINLDSLTIATGTAVAFSQSVNCSGLLALTGQVTMVSGASLTSVTANVVGNLSVSGGGSFVVTSLDVGGTGLINFTNAQLVANAAGVVLEGTFAVSNTWGTATVASMPLPFSDDFELYGVNTVMTGLRSYGWNASTNTVKVQTAVAHLGKAVVLPDGTILSNSINAASAQSVWTDYYVQPALGAAPAVQPVGSFVAYVNADGYLVVATNGGGWVICSNQLGNTLATPLQSNVFARVSICQNLSAGAQKFAVFVDGKLVGQGLAPPVGFTQYSSFVMKSHNVTAYVDDVLISTAIPLGLTLDLDHNGLADAYEINNYGLTSGFLPSGTCYKFR